MALKKKIRDFMTACMPHARHREQTETKDETAGSKMNGETEQMTEQRQPQTPGRDESKPKGKTREQLAQERKEKAERDLQKIQARKAFTDAHKALPGKIRDAVASQKKAVAHEALQDLLSAAETAIYLEIPEPQ